MFMALASGGQSAFNRVKLTTKNVSKPASFHHEMYRDVMEFQHEPYRDGMERKLNAAFIRGTKCECND